MTMFDDVNFINSKFLNNSIVYSDKYKTIKVTVKEVFEALKKNGFYLLRGQWESGGYGKIKPTAACALGQAALNLNVESGSLYKSLNTLPNTSKWKVSTDPYAYCGDVIVHWNDKFIPAYTKFLIFNVEGRWALETYEDITNMAYDVLSPHFNKVIKVYVREFTDSV